MLSSCDGYAQFWAVKRPLVGVERVGRELRIKRTNEPIEVVFGSIVDKDEISNCSPFGISGLARNAGLGIGAIDAAPG
ncbi:MAG: hypothetical protein R2706_02350 [Acidimicrobiales bacterium]